METLLICPISLPSLKNLPPTTGLERWLRDAEHELITEDHNSVLSIRVKWLTAVYHCSYRGSNFCTHTYVFTTPVHKIKVNR